MPVLALLLVTADPSVAQERDGGDADGAATVESLTEAADPDAVDPDAREDPCASEYLQGRSWIDWLNRGLHRTACETALWFDHLFGDYRLDDELEATHGRALLGLTWDEHHGFEEDLRFRARLDFPNMERRLNAFVGRDDRDDILEDTERLRSNALPELFAPSDDEWLVGLGYRPISGRNGGLDFDLGMNFKFPLEPWVRARYRHRSLLGEADLMRFRYTLFWERDDGWGLTARIDWEHAFGARSMLRWRGAGRFSDVTHGTEWFTELSYYHRLGRRRALSPQFGADGETAAQVRIENYFVRVVYRQQILREWLFLEIGPGMVWRREHVGQPRDSVPTLRIGTEMLFGDYRGQGTAARPRGR